MTIDILDAAREVQRIYLIEHGTREEMVAFRQGQFKADIERQLAQLRRDTPPADEDWPDSIVMEHMRLLRDVRKLGRHEPGMFEWANDIEREIKAMLGTPEPTTEPTNDSQEN